MPESPNPELTDVSRRIARRIAGTYFLFAAAWIAFSDLALIELTRDLPSFAGASLVKGGIFVLVSVALLYLLIRHNVRPYAESNPEVFSRDADGRLIARTNPAIIFGVMAVLMIVLVIAMFSYESSQHREVARNDLRAILELKADQLELVLAERKAMALSYSHSRSLRSDLTRYAQHPDPKIVSDTTDRLEKLRRDLQFEAVLVFDASGQMVAGVGPAELRRPSPELATQLALAMASGMPVSHYLHREAQLPGAPIVIDYITPLSGASDHARLGAIVLRDDARRQFFRRIQEWPTPSPSAESLLVRRDGDAVLFLNDVRHAKNTAFHLRRPLSETGLPAAAAVQAKTPLLMDGVDYRGVQVVAASRQIVDTDWFLITKVDRDEVLAPVRESTVIWLSTILCMMLLAAMGATWMWWQQNLLADARERAQQLHSQALVAHFRQLADHVNDIVVLGDENGVIVDVNDRAVAAYRRPREELIGTSAATLRAPESQNTFHTDLRRIRDSGAIFESVHMRKDGLRFPVEVSARAITVDGKRFVQAVVRDLTEIRQAVHQQQESEARFLQIATVVNEVFWMTPPDGMSVTYVSPAFEQVWGWTCDELYADPQLWLRAVHAEDASAVRAAFAALLQGIPYNREFRITRRDGSLRWIYDRGNVVRDSAGQIVMATGIASDITVRKQQEARIARLTHLREALSEVNRTIVHADSEDTLFAEICATAVRHCGFALTWIGTPDHDTGEVRRRYWVGEPAALDYLNRIRLSCRDVPEGRGTTGTALREGRIVCNNDLLANSRSAPWHDAARAAGIRSSAAFPLRKSGEVVAVFTVYAGTTDYFDAETADLLEEIAGDVSFALDVFALDRERAAALDRAMRLTAIVNHSPAIFFSWRTAAGWPVELVSDNIRSLGYMPDDFLLGHILYAQIIHPDDLARVTAEVERHSAAGVVEFSQEYRIRAASGEWCWMDDHTWIVRDESGRVTHYHGQLLDITERKRGQQALRESDARFQAVLEQSIVAVIVIQHQRITYANLRARQIFGYGPDEVFDADPMTHLRPEGRARVAAILKEHSRIGVAEPYSVEALRKDGTPFILGVHKKRARFGGQPALIAVAQDITEKSRAEEQVKHYVARLERAVQSTIEVVSTIGERRDPYTHGHERRVGEIASAIAVEMGLDPICVEGVRIAGYLHDVGKISVPAEILSKPSKLSSVELELVKDHARQSYEILKTVEFPWPIADIAWQHHERLDGNGYPQGLKGDAILLEARILAVADTIEAMASHRPYRPGLGVDKALAEIERGCGTAYDPQVVDACMRLFRVNNYAMPQ